MIGYKNLNGNEFFFLYVFYTHYDLRSGPWGPITPGGKLQRATENSLSFFGFIVTIERPFIDFVQEYAPNNIKIHIFLLP